MSLHEEFNREISVSDLELSQLHEGIDHQSAIDDQAGIVKGLEGKVLREKESLHIVLRRGTPLERVLNLWRREAPKVSPEQEPRIKFLGKDGIDLGALATEFLTSTVQYIGTKLFPNGNPVHSTNDIQNGNFQACGEIVATSLAQGGPPPCFLAECVYDTLILEGDIDFTSVSPEQYLTSTERGLHQQIQSNVLDQQESIIDHGYTGVIDEAHLDSITASTVVSILSRRALCLKQFKKGLQLYGLFDVISRYPELTRSLFVLGQKVGTNYLFSLMAPKFSPKGSSRRHNEEYITDYFQDLPLGLEDDQITGYTEAIAWNLEEELDVPDQSPTGEHQESETFSTQDDTSWSTSLTDGTETQGV